MNTGVGCHFLLQGIFPTQGSNLGLPHCRQMPYHLSYQGSPEWVSEVAQSCPTLCNPIDCNPPGSSIHGIFQARILEWGAISFSVTNASLNNWLLEKNAMRPSSPCYSLWLWHCERGGNITFILSHAILANSALFFFFFSCALENCPGQIGPTIFQPYLVISLSSHISHNSRSEKGQKVLTGRGPLLFTPLGLLNMFKVCSLLCKSFPEVRRSLPYNSSAGSLSQQIPGEAECLLTWFLSSTLASSEGCFASFFITSWAMCKVTNHPG